MEITITIPVPDRVDSIVIARLTRQRMTVKSSGSIGLMESTD
jgi:hypothetical protein